MPRTVSSSFLLVPHVLNEHEADPKDPYVTAGKLRSPPGENSVSGVPWLRLAAQPVKVPSLLGAFGSAGSLRPNQAKHQLAQRKGRGDLFRNMAEPLRFPAEPSSALSTLLGAAQGRETSHHVG